MKKSRSCAILLAAASAAVSALGLAQTQPTTLPTTMASATRPADTMPATSPTTAPTLASTMPATGPNATPTTLPSVASTPAPTTQTASDSDVPPGMIRLNFRDIPLDSILERISRDAGFTIVRETPVATPVTLISVQPVTPAQAVVLLNAVLDGNGMTALQSDNVLRIVAREKAKKGNLPVHFGAEPQDVADNNALITQVIPLKNVEAVKLRQDLTPLLSPETDIAANAAANALIMTDTSTNVRRVVQIVAMLDKREGASSAIKIIHLKNANASQAAKLILAVFRPEEPRLTGGAAQVLAQQGLLKAPEGRILGTGLDQAMHGAKVTAGADDRTNSVIVGAPSDTLKEIEKMLQEIDDNPATATQQIIKTFHLKTAEAPAVAKSLRLLFNNTEDAAPNSSHQIATDEALHSHVVVVYEERTNTLIVTAAPAAMAIAERLIQDLDSTQLSNNIVKSFSLKFADAPTTARLLIAVYQDPLTGLARVQAGSRDKVNVSSDLRTNTVFVTAPRELMELVEKSIKDIDAGPTTGTGVKFYHLKQADADSTAKLIINFFKPPETTVDKRPADAVHFGVNAVADLRTNTVAVTAPDEALATIDKIVKEVESAPNSALEIETFAFRNGDASAAAKLLTTVFQPDAQAANGVKPSGTDATFKAKVIAASDDRTNSLVVTAPADTLKVVESIVKMLDATPISPAQIQVYQLKNADPQMAGRLLESVFQPQIFQQNATAVGMPKPPGVLDAQHKLGWISTTADLRTSTLIVTAPPDILRICDGIVRQLDSNPAAQTTVFMYRLRNAQALNLQTVLNQLFGANQQGGLGASNALGAAGSRTTSSLNTGSTGTSGLGSLGSSGFGSSGGGLGSSSGAGGTGIGARRGTVGSTPTVGGAGTALSSQLSAQSNRVLSELAGQVYVVADNDTNSLLVTTATRFEKEVRDIILQLDRSIPQVLIKVLVAEVSHDNTADWGADFSILNQRASGKGLTVSQNNGNYSAGSLNGGLVVSLVEDNVNVQLHALATEGKLDVLSRPYILASDNQIATITVGQEVPFITNTQISITGQQINTIQYQDVGIILNVTPHINPEGLVILDVAPEISQLTGTTVPIGAGVAAPVIAKRSAQSRVGIKNGQTIVIGGMMEDSKTDTISKIPILGDIPLIGQAFRRTQTDKTKTELLIFMTPHVAQQPDVLPPMSSDEVNGVKLMPTAVSPGTFDDHLSGLKRGASPSSTTAPTTGPGADNGVIRFTPDAPPATSPSSGPIRLPQ